jgi:hypothetical protein
MWKIEKRLRDIWNSVKSVRMHLTGIQKQSYKENKKEDMLEESMI